MSDTTISVRIDEHIHNEMKMHDDINWSGIVRNSIAEKLEKLETIDPAKAKKAAAVMDSLRKSKSFDKEESSVKIIREWREKRR